MVAIEKINPFRYRGYYYDTETGFYYLQTRYYDPTICRFINADNYELIGELSLKIGGLNLYAYCGNNPIMFTDFTGCLWDTIKGWWNSIGGWEGLLRETKFVFDVFFESFYFDAGVGLGFGFSQNIGSFFSIELLLAAGGGIQILPDQEKGTFYKMTASLNFLNILDWSLGYDKFVVDGETKDDQLDFNVSVGGSAFVVFGGYWEFGFNFDYFSAEIRSR